MSSSDWIIIPTIGVSIKFHGSSHHQQVYQLYPQATGSMYDIYGNIYHQYTPNVSIYTIHGSYGQAYQPIESNSPTHQPTVDRHRRGPAGPDQRPNSRRHQGLKSRWTKLQQHSNWSGFIAPKNPENPNARLQNSGPRMVFLWKHSPGKKQLKKAVSRRQPMTGVTSH